MVAPSGTGAAENAPQARPVGTSRRLAAWLVAIGAVVVLPAGLAGAPDASPAGRADQAVQPPAQVAEPQPGEHCSRPITVTAGVAVADRLAHADDVRVYAVTVDRAFSRVELRVTDPEDRLALDVFQACGGSAGVRTGRHIGVRTGRHIGPEQRLVLNVTLRTGIYYLEVSSRVTDAPYPADYRLEVAVRALDPAEVHSLILTHEPRVQGLFGLAEGDPEMVRWREELERLAADPRVGGVVVRNLQHETDPAVQAAYSDWLIQPADAARANAVVAALREWVWAVWRELPGVRYVILVGDDRVIPQERLAIGPARPTGDGWLDEPLYLLDEAIDPQSTVGGGLAAGYTLSDDGYGAGERPVGRPGSAVPWPELAVGRLVERPADMSAVMEAFQHSGGRLVLSSSLVAGSGVARDAAVQVDARLAAAGLPADRRGQLLGPAWTAAELRRELFGAHHDLVFLALDSTHYHLELPDRGALRAEEVARAGAALSGTLVVALGSHGGLSVPGAEHPQAMDFPEAWLSRGAMLVAPTGWSYGMDHVLAFGEALGSRLGSAAARGGALPVGEVLAESKRAYLREHDESHFHAKTVAGITLFGLPMMAVDVAGPPPDAGAGRATATGAAAIAAEGSSAGRPASPPASEVWVRRESDYAFPRRDLRLAVTEAGTYLTFGGLEPLAESGTPVQPKLGYTLAAVERDGQLLWPRGVVITRARTRELTAFRPLILYAAVLGPVPAAQRPILQRSSEAGWQPRLPISVRRLPGGSAGPSPAAEPADVTLLFYPGQFHASTKTQRVFESITVDEFYSASTDETGPWVEDVSVIADPTGATAWLSATVTDASGVARVTAACDTRHRQWQASDLQAAASGGVYEGEVPMPSACLVQAVDRAGNVTWADNDGRFFGLRHDHGGYYRAWLPSARRQADR